jgi:hypothetical protein
MRHSSNIGPTTTSLAPIHIELLDVEFLFFVSRTVIRPIGRPLWRSGTSQCAPASASLALGPLALGGAVEAGGVVGSAGTGRDVRQGVSGDLMAKVIVIPSWDFYRLKIWMAGIHTTCFLFPLWVPCPQGLTIHQTMISDRSNPFLFRLSWKSSGEDQSCGLRHSC